MIPKLLEGCQKLQNKIASYMTVCLCFYFYANKLEWISDSQPFDQRGLFSVQICMYNTEWLYCRGVRESLRGRKRERKRERKGENRHGVLR